jgi:hypothetical protein
VLVLLTCLHAICFVTFTNARDCRYAWFYRTAAVTVEWTRDWANVTRGELGLSVNASDLAFPSRSPHAVKWTTAGASTTTTTSSGGEGGVSNINSNVSSFVAMVFHADPDDVEVELHMLGLVASALAATEDVLVFGDFNADCKFASLPFVSGCFARQLPTK